MQKHYVHKECDCECDCQLDQSKVYECLTLSQVSYLNSFKCLKCKKEAFEEIRFLYEPSWLIIEAENQSKMVNIDSLIKEISFSNLKYILLCCICSVNKGHFLGLYYFDNKFYLLDDIGSQGLIEITNTLEITLNSFIFIKKNRLKFND